MPRILSLPLVLLFLMSGCTETNLREAGRTGQPLDVATDDAGAASRSSCDVDGDGHEHPDCGGDDCDDDDARRFPGNTEICDGGALDEDCDPTTHGGDDLDGDGYADAACCNLDDEGALHCGDDCNDERDDMHPGAAEVCDGRDADCDGKVDEGVIGLYFADRDQDGYGDENTSALACYPPFGFVPDDGDCDDQDASVGACD